MEDEEIVKGYDPIIMKRILSFLRPHWKLGVIAIVALVIGTIAELGMPVVVQRSLDNNLLVNWARIPSGAEAPELRAIATGTGISALRLPLSLPDEVVVSGFRYVRSTRLSALSGKDRAALEKRGILEGAENGWYLFRPDAKVQGQAAVITAHASAISEEDGVAAVSRADMKGFTPAERRMLRDQDSSGLIVACLVFFILLVSSFAFNFIETFAAQLAGQRVMTDMRMRLFNHTVGQSMAFMNKNPVGRLVTRMTNDVETINQMFTDVLVAFMKDLSVMVGVFVVLFSLNPHLALITLCTLPPVAIVTMVSRAKARDAYRRQRLWMSRVNAYLSERLSGIQVVKLFARERASVKDFRGLNANLMKANLGEMYVFATFRPLVDLFAAISTGAIIYFGALQFTNLGISLGVLIAFINLIGRFYQPVQDISEKYTILQSAMAGGERVFQIMDADEAIPDSGTRLLPTGIRGHIEFDHVKFSYKKGEEIIRDLSFHVLPGETVAIVGYTGAGKTTLINLLTRLWDIDSGGIRLDGVPIAEIPLGDLRRAVQPVIQDVFLFSGTIMDNIRLGDDVSEERALDAARLVHAHEFIEGLQDGYNTVLSEGATNVSSGQRQLISFARVVARDPRVIILDEATSSIDTETERLIQLGMKELLRGRTSIVIAHRLSTIQHADRIFVMSAGRIVEEGNHQELLKARGMYYTLYRLQYENGFGDEE
jgi:ATP-binding cassette, subfamily B, multidrug efflux pump